MVLEHIVLHVFGQRRVCRVAVSIVGFNFPCGPVALFFVEQLEKERVRDKEKDKRGNKKQYNEVY